MKMSPLDMLKRDLVDAITGRHTRDEAEDAADKLACSIVDLINEAVEDKTSGSCGNINGFGGR